MLTVLNDLHIGAMRSAGTTPASQWALRQHLLSEFQRLLPSSGDLLLLGDTFDTGNVPIYDVLRAFEALADWLSTHPSATLYNVAGNHDLSRTSTTLSSFQFLGKLLSRQFPSRYVHIEQPTLTGYGYIIPHLRNQDVFDAAIAEIPRCQRVFLHANYANGFAAQSDQSLNVSEEQVEAMPCDRVVFAHEHHRRELGKVVITGNQIASSVSDWLSPGDKKYAVIDGDSLTLHTSAVRADEFAEVNWQNLSDAPDKKFIRVVGTASPDEMNSALSVLNKLRSVSQAFVITNAIQATSDESVASTFSEGLEAVNSFSIVSALRRILTQEEMTIIDPFLTR